MKIHFLCKRHYTNKDLLNDRFGRLFHLPIELSELGADVSVSAIDYRSASREQLSECGVVFGTIPATIFRLPQMIFELNRIVAAVKPDILIASGDSHIGFIGNYLARRAGARFVFDIYDYYPSFLGNRIPGMKAMFLSAVRNADLILCASEPLLHAITSHNCTLLIPNGVDRHLFRPLDKQAARRSIGIPHPGHYVGYFGSVTPNRGPLLIEACRRLNRSIPSLRLLLAGPVSRVDINEPWIIYHGVLPQELIPERIGACDVVVIPYADDTFNRWSAACKIAEYLACERPVVATNLAGHARFFRDAAFSLCNPDPEDMAAAIRYNLRIPSYVHFPEELEWNSIGKGLYQSLVKIHYGKLSAPTSQRSF